MVIFRDILLELRAIRIGINMLVRAHTGAAINLHKLAEDDSPEPEVARRKPRDRSAIIHRDPDRAYAREMLQAAGDDTGRMIEYMREQHGEEVAEALRKFHEEEIASGRRR